ncbi:hypothetical protein GCM10018952_15290 [Streptosporangium vulgare]
MQQAAAAANRDDSLTTPSSLATQPGSEQKASTPQPANTESPQSAARRRLATAGMTGEIRTTVGIPATAAPQSGVNPFETPDGRR